MTRINTNVQSLIARRVLGTQTQSLNQALNRLSTGLRINSGRDDPAGLIASEGLRSTQVSISAAVENARRADGVVSVVEGSLQEISSLLLEMEDLVDRSANEGGLSTDEVNANQLQIDTILESIDRIADTSSFGDIKLLDGSFAFTTSGVNVSHLDDVKIHAAKVPDGSYRDVTVEVQASSTQARLVYTGGALASNTSFQIQGNTGSERFSFVQGTAASAIAYAINSTTELTGVTASAVAAGTNLTFQSEGFGTDSFVSVTLLDGTFGLTADSAAGATATRDTGANGTVIVNGSQATVDGLSVNVNAGSLNMTLELDSNMAQSATTSSFQVTGGGAIFAISPQVGLAGLATLGIDSFSTASLGKQTISSVAHFLSSLASGQTNDMNSKNFATAQRVVRESIDEVSTFRGRLGAFQKNTLDTTVNSLLVTMENLTAAESAIRDADFAVETSNLTRAQILVNSSLLTLQAANQQPANVLQLLG
ncbi:MAG: flagellin [bacterium]|nr:flagellin [bacterium]